MFSPLNELYYNEEVCHQIDCPVALGAQPYYFVSGDSPFYDRLTFNNKIKNYAYDYIFKNGDLDQSVKHLKDLNKFYYVSLETGDSVIGLLFFIFVTTVLFIEGLLLILFLMFRKKLNSQFISSDIWFLSLVGAMFMLSTSYTFYGQVSSTKCFLKLFIFNTGFFLNVIPIFIQLVVNFPEINKKSEWFSQRTHQYLVIFTVTILQVIFLGIAMHTPFTIKNVMIMDGENYRKCVMTNTWSNILLNLVAVCRMMIHGLMFFFFFIEWNLQESIYEIRILFSLSVMDVLFLFIYQFFIDVNYNSYVLSHFFICTGIALISISNFALVYSLKCKALLKRYNSSTTKKNETRGRRRRWCRYGYHAC